MRVWPQIFIIMAFCVPGVAFPTHCSNLQKCNSCVAQESCRFIFILDVDDGMCVEKDGYEDLEVVRLYGYGQCDTLTGLTTKVTEDLPGTEDYSVAEEGPVATTKRMDMSTLSPTREGQQQRNSGDGGGGPAAVSPALLASTVPESSTADSVSYIDLTQHNFIPSVLREDWNATTPYTCPPGMYTETLRDKLDRALCRYNALVKRAIKKKTLLPSAFHKMQQLDYDRHAKLCTFLLWQRKNCFKSQH